MEPKPFRYAVLYSDIGHWTFHKCTDWIRMSDIDRYCEFQSHRIKRIQVFDIDNNLLMDRTYHPLLDEVA